jgi:hypothetical protein
MVDAKRLAQVAQHCDLGVLVHRSGMVEWRGTRAGLNVTMA